MSGRDVVASPFLEGLRGPGVRIAAELRPPPAGLEGERAVDAWIDLDRGVRRLLEGGRSLLFTDDAVGDREEESLHVLTANLGPRADLSRIVPFLTCKHPLDYCHLFARRAEAHGFGGVTVTGGDREAGHPRCLPRSRDLREVIRSRLGSLPLGAWVNPFRDPWEQVRLLLDVDHHADYFLTQVVSHHDLGPVEAFLEAADREGLRLPGMFGVFFYRSAHPGTLSRLGRFLPVPAEAITREFDEGASAEEICARTLRALRSFGLDKVYVSNLDVGTAEARLGAVESRL